MQSTQVSYYWLKEAGVSNILDFTTTSATSRSGERVRCSADAEQGELEADLRLHERADDGAGQDRAERE